MSVKSELSRKPSQHSASHGIDYVGFSNFPNQVFRRCIKNGFEFTLMVVGQSGLGKSTFLNSLFLAEVHECTIPSEIPSTVNIECKSVKLVENDVRLTMTFVDTPGFGDLVDNSKCWDPIVKFVDSKFLEYLNEETKVDRLPRIKDNLVQLCLYFIAPTGHRLKALDLEFMRALQDRVNIVPVIAKADTLTPDELARFKKNVMEDLVKHDVKLYEFPDPDLEIKDKRSGSQASNEPAPPDYRKRLPFAIVGSNNVKEIDRRRRVRIREYPWGVVEVENIAHNDFVPLRDLIIRNNMIELIDVTRNVHYENFRIRQMCNNSKNTLENDPFTQLEQDRKTCEAKSAAMREAKERLFLEKVSNLERSILERAQALEIEEQENERILTEKKAQLNKYLEEMADIRLGKVNFTDSGSSINSEKSKKKMGTLGLFNRH